MAAAAGLEHGCAGGSSRRHGPVIAFCQTLVVLLGAGGTVVLVRRLLQPLLLPWLGMASLTMALAAAGRWLVAVPS
jgi:hypothetical protein